MRRGLLDDRSVIPSISVMPRGSKIGFTWTDSRMHLPLCHSSSCVGVRPQSSRRKLFARAFSWNPRCHLQPETCHEAIRSRGASPYADSAMNNARTPIVIRGRLEGNAGASPTMDEGMEGCMRATSSAKPAALLGMTLCEKRRQRGAADPRTDWHDALVLTCRRPALPAGGGTVT